MTDLPSPTATNSVLATVVTASALVGGLAAASMASEMLYNRPLLGMADAPLRDQVVVAAILLVSVGTSLNLAAQVFVRVAS